MDENSYQQSETLIRQKLQVSRIIWAVLTVSLLIYPAMLLYLGKAGQLHVKPGMDESLSGVFTYAAILFGAASLWVRYRFLSPEWLRSGLAGKAGSEPQEVSAEVYIRTVSERWFLIHIINYALNEAVGLYGFVWAFMSADAHRALPFAAASILLDIGMFPRETTLRI